MLTVAAFQDSGRGHQVAAGPKHLSSQLEAGNSVALCRPELAESGETYPGAFCLGPQIIAIDSPFRFQRSSWVTAEREPLWADFIVGVDRVIEVFGCEARESGLRRHPAGDRFGKSERAQS